MLFQGFFQQFWEKVPDQKMIDLTSKKLREINDIEHNKGSKIYHQKSSYFRLYYAQVFKYHSDMGHCFSTSSKKKIHFFLSFV